MARNIETWFEIRDLAEKSLLHPENMTPENVREVVETKQVAAQKIREYVGQIALKGLEEDRVEWS